MIRKHKLVKVDKSKKNNVECCNNTKYEQLPSSVGDMIENWVNGLNEDELDCSHDCDCGECQHTDDATTEEIVESSDEKAINIVELFDGRNYEVEQFEDLGRFSPEELQNLISLIFKNRGLVMRELVGLIKADNDIDDYMMTKVYEFITHVLRGLGVDGLYNKDAEDVTSYDSTVSFRKFVIGTCIDTVNILNACIFNIQSFIIGGKNI